MTRVPLAGAVLTAIAALAIAACGKAAPDSSTSQSSAAPSASNTLSPTTPAHTPIARARSRGSVKTLVTMDSATGFSIDPPMACSARNAISVPTLGATPHSSEPRLNSASPVWNVRRRPIRSAVEPDSMSRLASTSV